MTWTMRYGQATLERALEGRCPGCGAPTKVVDEWSRCMAKPHPLLVEYQVIRGADGQLHIEYRYRAGLQRMVPFWRGFRLGIYQVNAIGGLIGCVLVIGLSGSPWWFGLTFMAAALGGAGWARDYGFRLTPNSRPDRDIIKKGGKAPANPPPPARVQSEPPQPPRSSGVEGT